MTLSLRDVKRSLTEQTIIEKALALFKERGFAQVSVRQIAKAALVSEKTVFNYFPYKELIVVAGMQPSLTAFMDEIQRQIDAIADPTEVLRNFGLNLAEICTADPEATAHRHGRAADPGSAAAGRWRCATCPTSTARSAR